MGKRKRRGRAKNTAPKPENLTDKEIKELMRHDGYERRGGAVRQIRRG